MNKYNSSESVWGPPLPERARPRASGFHCLRQTTLKEKVAAGAARRTGKWQKQTMTDIINYALTISVCFNDLKHPQNYIGTCTYRPMQYVATHLTAV